MSWGDYLPNYGTYPFFVNAYNEGFKSFRATHTETHRRIIIRGKIPR